MPLEEQTQQARAGRENILTVFDIHSLFPARVFRIFVASARVSPEITRTYQITPIRTPHSRSIKISACSWRGAWRVSYLPQAYGAINATARLGAACAAAFPGDQSWKCLFGAPEDHGVALPDRKRRETTPFNHLDPCAWKFVLKTQRHNATRHNATHTTRHNTTQQGSTGRRSCRPLTSSARARRAAFVVPLLCVVVVSDINLFPIIRSFVICVIEPIITSRDESALRCWLGHLSWRERPAFCSAFSPAVRLVSALLQHGRPRGGADRGESADERERNRVRRHLSAGACAEIRGYSESAPPMSVRPRL